MAKVGYEDALIEYFKRPENWPTSESLNYDGEYSSDDYCDICGEELSGESHYHCPRCGAIVSMMGHSDCDPKDVERYSKNRTEEQ